MCNLLRRFIEHYSKMAGPLYELTKRGQPKNLPTLCPPEEKDFNEFMERVTNPLVRAMPRNEFLYSVDRDALDQQFGAALFQDDKINRTERQTVGYCS